MGKILVWVGLGLVILLLVRLLGPGKRHGRDDGARGAGARDDGARGDQRGDGSSRNSGSSGNSGSAGNSRDDPREPPRELMMRCAVCSVHVPSSEAVFAGGKVYCSAAHRDAARGD